MLHRAVFGSIERFIGILIEHYAGAFPLWLSPTQIAVLPVNNDAHLKHAKSVVRKLEKQGLRVELDDSNEKLGYRLRNSQINKIPYTLVIGDKERNDNLVTYRKFGDKAQITVPYREFIALIKREIRDKA
jgi:threonyl-tRNA synthetase